MRHESRVIQCGAEIDWILGLERTFCAMFDESQCIRGLNSAKQKVSSTLNVGRKHVVGDWHFRIRPGSMEVDQNGGVVVRWIGAVQPEYGRSAVHSVDAWDLGPIRLEDLKAVP